MLDRLYHFFVGLGYTDSTSMQIANFAISLLGCILGPLILRNYVFMKVLDELQVGYMVTEHACGYSLTLRYSLIFDILVLTVLVLTVLVLTVLVLTGHHITVTLPSGINQFVQHNPNKQRIKNNNNNNHNIIINLIKLNLLLLNFKT